MQNETFYAMCEALLFSMSEPVMENTVMQITAAELNETENLNFQDFVTWFNARHSGLQVIRVAGGWLMVTRAEYSDAVRSLKTSCQKTRFSRAALETLAIIAYRQPVSTPEIEQIRGVDSTGILKNLLEKNLVKVLGRKRSPGNPLLYGTTTRFLVVFGLDSIESLPKLDEFETSLDSMHASVKNLPFRDTGRINRPVFEETADETHD
jgi:segregation and condensation protein B